MHTICPPMDSLAAASTRKWSVAPTAMLVSAQLQPAVSMSGPATP